MKIILKINSWICVLSPWIFGALRLTGIVNTRWDLLVFIILLVVMTATAFLTFGGNKDESLV